ncbi:MAG: hypothetical protein FWF80_07800 [Defluviitaleaceae bacterium]|nr:hypothetical protein [Defluviitaleaceae bacterium]
MRIMRIVKLIFKILAALFCGIGMTAILFVTYYYLFGLEEAAVPGQMVQVNMRSDLTPTVHYGDSMIHEPGPQPRENIQYLTYFTDFIEAKSSFRASFSRPVNVAYRFRAMATLTIRRDGGGGGVVYQERFMIDEAFDDLENVLQIYNFTLRRDRDFEDYDDWWDWFQEDHPPDWDDDPEDEQRQLAFSVVEGNLTGGIVQVDLDEFLEIVDEFVSEIAHGTGMVMNTSADLEVEFSHRIFIRDYGVDETISRGLNVPLRHDSFTFNTTGTPTHSAMGRLDTRAVIETIIDDDNTPDLIIELVELLIENEDISETFVIYFALLLLPLFAAGLYFSVGGGKLVVILVRKMKSLGKRLSSKLSRHIKDMSGSYERKVKKLVKKYSNEIVVVSSTMKRDDMETNIIAEFAELLKLSLFTNRPIFCYHNIFEKYAEFAVIYEGQVHCFMICEEKIEDDE